MLSVVNLLDAARLNSGIPSDYRLSRVLGIADNTLFAYRHSGRVPIDDVVVKLASLAKLSPSYVLNCMSAERAKEPEVKAAYLAAAAALAGGLTPPGAGKLSGPSGGGVTGSGSDVIGGSSAKGSPVACAPVYTS